MPRRSNVVALLAAGAVACTGGDTQVVAPPPEPPEPAAAPVEREAGGGALAAERLSALKAATVYIERREGAGVSSGSGFVVGHEAGGAVIVTNQHVVGQGLAEITVVLQPGDEEERRVRARVAMVDRAQDLAFLVIPADAPPEPIPSTPAEALRETQSVFVLGFPFGSALSSADARAPSITVSRASISAFRRDARGALVAVQIDGGIHPGNSGGPIVTADGRLVGVAVAKVEGTTIGFAIPAASVRALLAREDVTEALRRNAEAAPLVASAPAAAGVRPAGPLPAAPAPEPEVASRDRVTPLPAPVLDVAVAAHGALLLLQLKGRDGLAVYDAEAGRLAPELPLRSTPAVIAAGDDVAVVYYRAEELLESWRISTRTRLAVRRAELGIVTDLCMGHASGDRVLARFSPRGGGWTRLALLDAETLAVVRTAPMEAQSGHHRGPGEVHLRSDPSLELVASWATSHSPGGVALLDAHTLAPAIYRHESSGWLVPAEGRRVYAGSGAVLDARGEPLGRVRGAGLVPAVQGGPLALAITRDGALRTVDARSLEPLGAGAVGQYPGWTSAYAASALGEQTWEKTELTLDRRIVFDPAADRLVLVALDDRAVIQRPLSPEGAPGRLAITSRPPARAAPGELFTYDVETTAGQPPLTYRLVRGPAGMTMTSLGVLAWPAPAARRGAEAVELVVEDARGQRAAQAFTLAVR